MRDGALWAMGSVGLWGCSWVCMEDPEKCGDNSGLRGCRDLRGWSDYNHGDCWQLVNYRRSSQLALVPVMFD